MSQNFINNHYNSAFKYHNYLGKSRFEELDIDNFPYAFGPCFEVLEENKPLQINISTDKRGKGVFLQNFVNNHSSSSFKYQNSHGPNSLGELIIEHC